jgi:nucleotide-binding universal stress UspA family protein
MRILHATDFSHTAERARALAADLQRRSSGTLHVVHVQERFLQGPGRAYLPAQTESINAELQRRLEEERQRETEQLRERLARLEEGGASSELVWGEPLRELLRLAPSFDLVAMGAHGQHPFDAVFLGGVAGRLVRRSTTPVLTVRASCSQSRIARVLVATDFQEAALAAWTFALDLHARAGVELLLAHVDESREVGDAQVIQRRLEALSAGRAARLMIARGNPIEVLPRLAEEAGADAIAVGMRRHGAIAGLIMGTRGDALVRSSAIPILSIPAT